MFDRRGAGLPTRYSTHRKLRWTPRDQLAVWPLIENEGTVATRAGSSTGAGRSDLQDCPLMRRHTRAALRVCLTVESGLSPRRHGSFRREEETSVVSHQTGRVESSR